MGQVWSGLRNKRNIPEEYLNRIIDTIFDSASYSQAISGADQMHEAIVKVFKKINETPGANWAPPSKESVVKMLKDYKEGHNKKIDREEFRRFFRQQYLSKPVMPTYARELLIVTVAVPAAATLTKMALPAVSDFLSHVPNTLFYASAVAAGLSALLVRYTYCKK